jgi:hypothetical protein
MSESPLLALLRDPSNDLVDQVAVAACEPPSIVRPVLQCLASVLADTPALRELNDASEPDDLNDLLPETLLAAVTSPESFNLPTLLRRAARRLRALSISRQPDEATAIALRHGASVLRRAGAAEDADVLSALADDGPAAPSTKSTPQAEEPQATSIASPTTAEPPSLPASEDGSDYVRELLISVLRESEVPSSYCGHIANMVLHRFNVHPKSASSAPGAVQQDARALVDSFYAEAKTMRSVGLHEVADALNRAAAAVDAAFGAGSPGDA